MNRINLRGHKHTHTESSLSQRPKANERYFAYNLCARFEPPLNINIRYAMYYMASHIQDAMHSFPWFMLFLGLLLMKIIRNGFVFLPRIRNNFDMSCMSYRCTYKRLITRTHNKSHLRISKPMYIQAWNNIKSYWLNIKFGFHFEPRLHKDIKPNFITSIIDSNTYMDFYLCMIFILSVRIQFY